MSKNKQVAKKCQDCLHYEMCLKRFRKLKEENQYTFIDENEYFAHAEDCEFHIKASDVAREIFEEIDKIIAGIQADNYLRKLGFGFISKDEKTIEQKLAELKKKYESEGVDDE